MSTVSVPSRGRAGWRFSLAAVLLAAAAAERRRADLSDPDHPPDRAVPGRRLERRDGPADRAASRKVARPDRDRRQPSGRGRTGRHRGGGARDAGRPHAAAGRVLAHGAAGAQSEAALQHREGFRAGHAGQHQCDVLLRASERAGEHAHGVRRAREEGTRQVQLRLARRRQPDPADHRAAEPPHRHQAAAHSLSRRRAGDAGDAHRRNAFHHAGAERASFRTSRPARSGRSPPATASVIRGCRTSAPRPSRASRASTPSNGSAS